MCELLLLVFILQNIVHTHTHTHKYTCVYRHVTFVYAHSLPVVSLGIFLYHLKGEVSNSVLISHTVINPAGLNTETDYA